ncbi:MAG: pitrilysin family protein [candidate division Zixibacteria bacterium]
MANSIRSLILFLLFLSMPAAAVSGFDFSEIEKSVVDHTLDNGLKLIIVERHEAPVVSFFTWANVGSADDPKEYTGLAHMFEHMAFKGTTTLGSKNIEEELKLIAVEDSLFMLLRAERLKRSLADSALLVELETAYNDAREASFALVEPNEFTQTIEREGCVGLNAFTSNDQTAYMMSLPSNRVELWMALESERFLNPVLREMYKERDVIAEERRMRVESSPFGKVLAEELPALAFKAHPYGICGVGHMSDINNYSRQEAEAFFEKFYGPGNLVLSIVGDVNAKDVIKMAEQYFGRIPARPNPLPIATVEPPQLGERRMVMEDPSQPLYVVGWHIPEITHPDRNAIGLLLQHLAQGRTSMLYKSMVKEKKVAMMVDAAPGWPGDKYPTLAVVYTMPAQGHDNLECEAEIFASVDALKETLVTEADLEKMRAQAKSSFINGLVSNSGMGMQLAAMQQYYGDWRELFTELDRINAVTAEDIKRVANEYFTTTNRNVVMLNSTSN